MAKARKATATQISASLDELNEWQSSEAVDVLRSALKATQNSLAAKAAKICAQQLLYDLVPDLLDAYQRFLEREDKNCIAKTALIKALYELDYLEPKFYRDGIRYQQFEPVWGGRIDSAVDIRCSSAFGLAASTDPRAIFELLVLLSDAEAAARSAAVNAIALLNPLSAEIALRTKALQGDENAAVIGDCFAALLRVEPDYSVAFVAGFLDNEDEELREQAALTLGESRLETAFECLRDYYCEAELLGPFREVLLRAIALQGRTDYALNFLLNVIENEDRHSAAETLKALSIHQRDDKIRQRVTASIEKANSKKHLQRIFEEEWQV